MATVRRLKMKKLLVVALVLLFTIPMLFAADKKFEILYFVGGMGEMANFAVEKLRANHPDIDITVEYNHKAHDILRNKIMSGNAPDIAHVNQGLFDYYGAIAEDLLEPIDFIYDANTLDGSKKMRDIFFPSDMDSSGFVGGKHYLVPEVAYLGGFWYSEKLVNKLGIKVPETWDQFMAACAKFKQNKIAPFGYLGNFAHEYPLNYFFMPMLDEISHQAYVDVQNLKPDAWKSPAVRELLDRIVAMRDKGYFWPPSTTAGIEGQQEFTKSNIGMMPCGSWLYAEMLDSWPKDFGLKFAPVPGKKAASGTNTVLSILLRGSVPKPLKNKDLVIEYYRYLLNDRDSITKNIKANQFIMPIKGFSENFGQLLPPAVASAVSAVSKNATVANMWSSWYATLPVEAGNAINALVSGNQTVDDFIKRMTDATKKVIDDKGIPKYGFR
jgi:N-acetylglucosamine transport system substrate-binding protein